MPPAPRVLLLVLLVPALVALPAPAAGPVAFAEPDVLDAGIRPAVKVSAGAEPIAKVGPDGTIYIGDTSGLYRSTDGVKWTRSPDPFLWGLFGDGWPVAFDAAGTLFAADTQGQVIGVASSMDGGKSWSTVASVVAAGPIADRPWLAAGAPGEVALIWFEWPLGEFCAYSNDGGVTWSQVSLTNWGRANAGDVEFGSDGRIYFATDSVVYRWNAECKGAAAPAHLPRGGAQIMTQIEVTPTDRVFVAEPSADNGAIRLHGLEGIKAQTRKTITLSPATLRSNTFAATASMGDQEVAVAWYGSTSAGNPSISSFQGDWNVYVARVRDFWTDTPNLTVTQVTTTPNHKGWFCMGGTSCTSGRALLDYMGLDYDAAGNLHIAYGHDVGGPREVRYAFVPAP